LHLSENRAMSRPIGGCVKSIFGRYMLEALMA
jgi:hypothetical protein